MSVMIGLPCGGGNICEQTVVGLFNFGKDLRSSGINHALLTLSNSSLINQARSRISNFFINNTDFDYLFFLDSDIGFRSEDVFKLMRHQLPIVSATYPMKVLPTRWMVNPVQPEERRGDLLKIHGNGLGFTLIHRQVFLDINTHYPGLKYVPSDHHSEEPHSEGEMKNSFHHFAETKADGGFMSEDKAFFHRAKQVGYDAWLDTSIRLKHTGYHIYEG